MRARTGTDGRKTWNGPRSAAASKGRTPSKSATKPSTAVSTRSAPWVPGTITWKSRWPGRKISSTRSWPGSFGITIPNQVVVMFHCGSRGFGHQVATDYLQVFLKVMEKQVPDQSSGPGTGLRPFSLSRGAGLLRGHEMRRSTCPLPTARSSFTGSGRSFPKFSAALRKPRDAHGLRCGPQHRQAGEARRWTEKTGRLLVHRKGATRAFGPGAEGISPAFTGTSGQPVIIGGSMETGSYLLVGTSRGRANLLQHRPRQRAHDEPHKGRGSFGGEGSSSRRWKPAGIYVRTASCPGLAEEAGGAYKDIDDVILATETGRHQQAGRALHAGRQCEGVTGNGLL